MLSKLRRIEQEARYLCNDADAVAWVSDMMFTHEFSRNQSNERLASWSVALSRLLAVRCEKLHQLTEEAFPGSTSYQGTFEQWLAEFGESVAPDVREAR